MAKIYRHRNNAPDEYIGRIEAADGRVYSEKFGPDTYLGRVDYEKGEVHAHQRGPDNYLGRVDDERKIFAHQFGPDEYEARVEKDGKIYRHRRLKTDEYVGRIQEMRHPVEGAAAWFFFFKPDPDEVDKAQPESDAE